MVAFPADYGKTGVKTFIVNHYGVAYERALGPNAARERIRERRREQERRSEAR